MKRLANIPVLLSLCFPAIAQDRMPPIPKDKLTEVQRKAVEDLTAGRHGGVIGPYIPLLRSPKLLNLVYAMGGYLRFETALGPRLTEMAILLASRNWTQQFEWNAHEPLALKAGLKQEIVTAIAEGRRPMGMADGEDIVYDFSTELNWHRSVSDGTYARTVQRFGEQGVVDLASLNGFYAMLAMIMNVARTPVIAPAAPPLAPFPVVGR